MPEKNRPKLKFRRACINGDVPFAQFSKKKLLNANFSSFPCFSSRTYKFLPKLANSFFFIIKTVLTIIFTFLIEIKIGKMNNL